MKYFRLHCFLAAMCFGLFYQAACAQETIYNPYKPHVVKIWSRIADYSAELRAVESAELSPSGRWVASVSKFGYKVMLWDVADGRLVWENHHESEVECVTFSPDGKLVASGGEDYLVKIWDAKTGDLLYELEHDSGLDGIAWANGENMLASGSEKGDLWFWDIQTFKLISKENVGSTINSLQFTNDDAQIVVAGNIQTKNNETGRTDYAGFIKLYDRQKAKVTREFHGHTGSVKSVRVSADEKYLASASFDKSACIFDFESGKLLHQIKADERMEAVAITPDNQFLAVGGQSNQLDFYRLKDFQKALTISCPRVEYIHFSADGRLMVTAHEDSGLLNLYLFVSDYQNNPNYHKKANQQLKNKELKNE